MLPCPLYKKPLAVALSIALLAALTPQASAQTAQPTAPDEQKKDDGLQLDRVVVTGTAVARSKLRQSVSVSTLDAEELQKAPIASATEALRTVPGIRAESSGGEGNANLGVRGLPMSDGGGRFVQLQEDGLPILLFGDISFATADEFLRADHSLDSVEAIRGGSSATLSTNSPGAIINFLSKRGKDTGGSVGISLGLDYRQQRFDYDLSSALGNKTWFSVGGYYRTGEGPRKTDTSVENGGQVKLSLLKEFDNGHVRLTYKRLSDKTPTYLPVPVRLNGNNIEQFGSVDPRSAFFVNSHFVQDVVTDNNGQLRMTNPGDGLAVNVDSFGVEAQFKLGEGWMLTNRFRKSAIDGRFLGVFPAGGQPANYSGTTPVFSAHIFNTSLDDMGNTFNDLRLQKEIALDAGAKATLTGGLFTGKQRIAQTWYWNRYNIGLTGEGAALYDNRGRPSSSVAAPATETWGGCCVKQFDYDITATAPFAAVTYEAGPLSVDASVRNDRQSGTGRYLEDLNNTGVWDFANATAVKYSTSGNSYSLGANLQLDRGTAVFGRASRGVSWKSPDRVLGANAVTTGAEPYPLNTVTQVEGGVKYRAGGLSAFITGFMAKTDEGAGFEVTTQTIKSNSYDSKGVELEVAYRAGDLKVAGGATLTDAEITTGANKGKTPRRQAKLIYQVSPSYRFGPVEVGAQLIGTTSSYAQDDNAVILPAYAVLNVFASYELASNLNLAVGINNLTDKLAYTEAEGQNNLGNNPLYIARALNGRTAKMTLKYSF